MLRFKRRQLERILSDDSILILDTKTQALSLVVQGRLVEQEVFYTKIRETPRGAAFVELLWESYPGVLTHERLIEWHNQESFAKFRATHSRWTHKRDWLTKAVRDHIHDMRDQFAPFGIGIASRIGIGYELVSRGGSPTRNPERFEDIALPGIIEAGCTLTLDHQKRVLTLLQGSSIVEQVILIPTLYAIFRLLVQDLGDGCSNRDLVMLQYEVSEVQADKWIQRGLRESEAQRELMIPIRLKIKKLRAVLKPFGISVENTATVGYSLGRVASSMRVRKGVQYEEAL